MYSSIFAHETPDDFYYFRSKSKVYQNYLKKSNLIPVPHGEQFGWLKNIFWLFQVAKCERTELPPNLAAFRKQGFKRWLMIWVPWHAQTIQKPWRKLYLSWAHFEVTWYSLLREKYYQYWNERSRRARKKFLANEDLHVECVEHEEFAQAFLATKVQHMFKSDYVKFFRSIVAVDPSSIRSYLVYNKDRPIAWLAVHDFDNISVHLVAFTSKEAKPLQAWTGLIDRWFSDSLKQGKKYIHFDHFRDSHMTKDQQGYTDFKLNFIDTLVRYPHAYFRFIWSNTKE